MLVTSGDQGSNDPQATLTSVAAMRETEAQEAALALGMSEVSFLRYPDGNVENTHALRGELVAWIRRWQPQVLFTHDPEHPLPPYLAHRDHRIVGRAALDAIYPLARDRLAFAEQVQAGLAPHAVQEVWLFASRVADGYVDVTTGFARKLAARLAHKSQTVDPAALMESWHRRAQQVGEPVGLLLAEAFTILRLEE
jgi:LmbE family N-acetylglucosaminyl deacetylase